MGTTSKFRQRLSRPATSSVSGWAATPKGETQSRLAREPKLMARSLLRQKRQSESRLIQSCLSKLIPVSVTLDSFPNQQIVVGSPCPCSYWIPNSRGSFRRAPEVRAPEAWGSEDLTSTAADRRSGNTDSFFGCGPARYVSAIAFQPRLIFRRGDNSSYRPRDNRL